MRVGIDTSTRSICIGYFTDGGIFYEWIALESKSLFDKMFEAYKVTYEWLSREGLDPMVVLIEEPVYVNNGKTHKALCCIYGSVVMAFLTWGITPIPVNIMKWKKEV